MNFKETALLLGLSMTVPATSIAQDKVEASVGADLVSGYIWRGQDLGGVSIQPSLSVAYKGFSLGAWGSAGCNLQIFLCLFLEKLNMPQNTPVTKVS